MPRKVIFRRRDFLKLSGLAAWAPSTFSSALAQTRMPTPGADYTLHIAPGQVEVKPGRVVSTTLYNGQFPGPLLRLTEGKRTAVDIYNDTDIPEVAHWHGQMLPSDVDGAIEEGTPVIAPHTKRRIDFAPKPAGFRFLHTHVVAGGDLNRGTYSGQAAPVYIEPKANAGAYDREVFLVLKEFEPSFSRGGDMDMKFLAGEPSKKLEQIGEAADERNKRHKEKGFEVNYKSFTINGKMLGHGEPIRVRVGERVLFHVLNASAGEIRSLGLPGHVFRVVALDGNPVPTPTDVPVLWLGTAERISAIVEMQHPGVWVLGDLDNDDREHGMGIVLEYAGQSGEPKWDKPKPLPWDY
jgi:FtsP/CotA-like multicopper oxidase with cupredoxin domain